MVTKYCKISTLSHILQVFTLCKVKLVNSNFEKNKRMQPIFVYVSVHVFSVLKYGTCLGMHAHYKICRTLMHADIQGARKAWSFC